MSFTTKKENDIVIVTADGRIDSNNANDFEGTFSRTIAEGNFHVIMNFEYLNYMSSVGLRVLLVTAKQLKNNNGKIVFCNMKPHIREVFDVSGFSSLFFITETLQDAIAAF